jgi:MoaA/NifB/PqqE/SkfB family radical SAM enzyme
MDPNPDFAVPILKLLSIVERPPTGLAVPNESQEARCPFVWRGAAAVKWNGDVSPCVALMHSYKVYMPYRDKDIKSWSAGNISDERFLDIWNKKYFVDFRDRVMDFDFSPCVDCGGCNLGESNQQDCIGNPHPVCGDCLWARKIILCP